MKIEVGRFYDERLKVLRKHSTTDSNVRINETEISICSRNNEPTLEVDVLTAANLYNLTLVNPRIREEINKILIRYLGKNLETLVK